MKFEPKISGVRVTDYSIKLVVDSGILSLQDCMDKIQSQDAMNFILDTLRFTKCPSGWLATIDLDTAYKIAVLENYPEYVKEFTNYFGENWANHYIRFGH